MKKLLTVSFLPLILFIGCDALDDLEACNEYTEEYNTADAAYASSFLSGSAETNLANCEAHADAIGVLVENDCTLNLAGTGYETWDMDSVSNYKSGCASLWGGDE